MQAIDHSHAPLSTRFWHELSPIWNARGPEWLSRPIAWNIRPQGIQLSYWRTTPKAQKRPMNSSHLLDHFRLETFSGLPSHRDRPFHSWYILIQIEPIREAQAIVSLITRKWPTFVIFRAWFFFAMELPLHPANGATIGKRVPFQKKWSVHWAFHWVGNGGSIWKTPSKNHPHYHLSKSYLPLLFY